MFNKIKFQHIFIGIVALLILIAGYFVYSLKIKTGEIEQVADTDVSGECTPAFQDGGGPYYKPNSPFREKIVPDKNAGEKLYVSGRVFLRDCKTPVSGAVLDIWQANESGSYEDEWYRGQIKTDEDGKYKFESIIPKGYGEGTGYRPPHIHFKVFINNTEKVTSQMFFPEIKGAPGFDDAFIMQVESKKENGTSVHYASHDIVLPVD